MADLLPDQLAEKAANCNNLLRARTKVFAVISLMTTPVTALPDMKEKTVKSTLMSALPNHAETVESVPTE
jgi:hypothetical protein